MIGVPTLFERNPRTRTLTKEYVPLNAARFHEWEAMERIPGAEVRVTVRNRQAVRLEVVKKPEPEQRAEGILIPWYRDAGDVGADHWLFDALRNTDLSQIPDGEWAGEAVGEKIMRNPLNLEGNTILFSSLFPWRESLPDAPIPPAVGRTPFGYDDLKLWLPQEESRYSPAEGTPIDGVVWWWTDTPVAQIRTRDFGTVV